VVERFAPPRHALLSRPANVAPDPRGTTARPCEAHAAPSSGCSRAGPRFERDGFFEREIGRREDRFGNIVHVFSAYESLHTPSDPQPFARGVNSIQLFYDGTRWWIVTVLWDSTEGQPDPRTLRRHE
jgi:hypothetical protein